MTQPAAFKAAYSDWRLVKTRQVVQVIFEVPLADADAAYTILGGMPNPATENWFGIAALALGVAEQRQPEPEPEPEQSQKERREWRELQPSAQAAIRCNEPVFWAFLREDCQQRVDDPASAATAVRKICGVNTRAAFNTNHAARVCWHQLDSKFGAWKMSEQVT